MLRLLLLRLGTGRLASAPISSVRRRDRAIPRPIVSRYVVSFDASCRVVSVQVSQAMMLCTTAVLSQRTGR